MEWYDMEFEQYENDKVVLQGAELPPKTKDRLIRLVDDKLNSLRATKSIAEAHLRELGLIGDADHQAGDGHEQSGLTGGRARS